MNNYKGLMFLGIIISKPKGELRKQNSTRIYVFESFACACFMLGLEQGQRETMSMCFSDMLFDLELAIAIAIAIALDLALALRLAIALALCAFINEL
jgi:hypothetical protein